MAVKKNIYLYYGGYRIWESGDKLYLKGPNWMIISPSLSKTQSLYLHFKASEKVLMQKKKPRARVRVFSGVCLGCEILEAFLFSLGLYLQQRGVPLKQTEGEGR